MNRCGSFPLLSVPHSLFSIWTDLKRPDKIPGEPSWRWEEWIWLTGSSRLHQNSPQRLNINSIRVFDQIRNPNHPSAPSQVIRDRIFCELVTQDTWSNLQWLTHSPTLQSLHLRHLTSCPCLNPYDAKGLGYQLYSTLYKLPREVGHSFCLFFEVVKLSPRHIWKPLQYIPQQGQSLHIWSSETQLVLGTIRVN